MSASVVFLFPGLGNHHVEMGLGLYRSEPVFREELDRCAALLRPHLGLELTSVLYPGGTSSAVAPSSAAPAGAFDLRRMLGRDSAQPSPAAQRLNETWLAQPAVFAVEYALARLLMRRGFVPDKLIGYSLGEYVAACVAGVISLEDALAVVSVRARRIQDLPPGAMLAVPLAASQVGGLLGPELSISAINGAELCVVAGPPLAVQRLQQQLEAEQVACRRIPTTHAFHSSTMRVISDELAEQMLGVRLAAPRIPYVSNVTGGWISLAEASDPGYWTRHLCETVRFSDGLATLLADGPVTVLEVGPGQALSSVVQQHPGFARWPTSRAVPTMRYEYDGSSDEAVLARALEALSPGAPSQAGTAQARAALPAGENAEKLAEIWRTILRVERVEPAASFFESGGNSLLATQLLFRIRKTFGADISLRAVFSSPKFCDLLGMIEDGAKPLTPRGSSAPAAAAAASAPLLVLPNGLEIAYQSQAETQHFYEDIFEHRGYLRCGVELPEKSCVFDVGANIGLFSLFIGTQFRDARLFSFEPAPPLFALLKANVERHRIPARLFNCGISSRPGTARFTFYPASSGMSSFYPDLDEEKHVLRAIMQNQLSSGMPGMSEVMAYSEELLEQRFASQEYECPLRTLSDVIAEHGVERVDLLKVDVQKAEYDVLCGIAADDWPKIRQVVAEVHDIDGRVAATRDLLKQRGFFVEVIQDELYRGSNIVNLYALRRGRMHVEA